MEVIHIGSVYNTEKAVPCDVCKQVIPVGGDYMFKKESKNGKTRMFMGHTECFDKNHQVISDWLCQKEGYTSEDLSEYLTEDSEIFRDLCPWVTSENKHLYEAWQSDLAEKERLEAFQNRQQIRRAKKKKRKYTNVPNRKKHSWSYY